jgi:integrase
MLNHKQIEALKAPTNGKPAWHTVAPNLRLSVSPQGVKRFVVRYSVEGKQRDRTLGTFGAGEHHLSLKEALAQTAVVVSGAAENTDVVTAQRVQKAVENGNRVADAFEAFFAEKIAEKKGKRGRKDGGTELRRQYEKYWGAHFGNHPLQAITKTAVIKYLRSVAGQGKAKPKNRTAVMLLVDIKQFMLWCSKTLPYRAMVAETDFFAIEKVDVVIGNYDPVRDNEKDRVLADEEIVVLYARMADSTLPQYVQHAVTIMLGTGCRVGELTKAEWNNVNLDAAFWYLPDPNTKSQADMRVSLAPFTLRAFQALKEMAGDSAFVFPRFPNVLDAEDRPIDVQTVGKHLANRQTSAAVNSRRRRTADFDGLMLAGGKWTAHDLRRTLGRVMRSGCGIAKDVAHMCMNHVQETALDRIYFPDRQTPQMHDAWMAAGAYLDKLLGFKPAAKKRRHLQTVA